ncbi:S8 family serine peptidase [Mycoplasmopsis columboralis]|nr:S8 family serine peptidase [Mycoplasmopsis columboralis]
MKTKWKYLTLVLSTISGLALASCVNKTQTPENKISVKTETEIKPIVDKKIIYQKFDRLTPQSIESDDSKNNFSGNYSTFTQFAVVFEKEPTKEEKLEYEKLIFTKITNSERHLFSNILKDNLFIEFSNLDIQKMNDYLTYLKNLKFVNYIVVESFDYFNSFDSVESSVEPSSSSSKDEGNLDISNDKNFLFSENFKLNNFTYSDWIKNIQSFEKNKKDYENNKIAIVEALSKPNKSGFVNENDSYLFYDKSLKIHNIKKIRIPTLKNLDNWNTPENSKHATRVASIIAGKSGINPHFFLRYFSDIPRASWVEQELQLEIISLTDSKVVNFSLGWLNNNNDLTYEEKKKRNLNPNEKYLFNILKSVKYSKSAWIKDKFISDHPEIVFVFAAGNNDRKQHTQKEEKDKEKEEVSGYIIEDPYSTVHNPLGIYQKLNGDQLSFNSIIVGSHDNKHEKSWFSSNTSFYSKQINFLASGENYKFGKRKSDIDNGTSYSAPFISGIVGQTFIDQKEKYDIGYNSLITSAVFTVSTDDDEVSRNRSQVDLGRNGAGIFNYKKLKEAFSNLKYIKIRKRPEEEENIKSVINSDIKKDKILVEEIFLKKGDSLKIAMSWLFKNKVPEGFFDNPTDFQIMTDYDIVIKNISGDVILKTSKINTNLEYLKLFVKENDLYKIFVYRPKTNKLDFINEDDLAISYTIERKK